MKNRKISKEITISNNPSIIIKDRTNNRYKRSQSTLDLMINNSHNEKSRLLISSPKTNNANQNTSKNAHDQQIKMNLSDLTPNNSNNKEISSPLESIIQNNQSNSNTSKQGQIIAYNEFLKDENFNLRMALEKQKIKISSIEEKLLSQNINSGEYEKIKEKYNSLAKEYSDLKSKSIDKLIVFVNYCKKYISKSKEMITILRKNENTSALSESRELILNDILAANESFYKTVFNEKLTEIAKNKQINEDKKDNINDFLQCDNITYNPQFAYIEVIQKLEKELASFKDKNEKLMRTISNVNKTEHNKKNNEEVNKETMFNKTLEEENKKLKNKVANQQNEIYILKETNQKLQNELTSKHSVIEYLDNILKTSINNTKNDTSNRLFSSPSKVINDNNLNTLLFSNQALNSPIRNFIDDVKKEEQDNNLKNQDLEQSFVKKYLKGNENNQMDKGILNSPACSSIKSSFLKQEIDTLDLELKQLQGKFKHMLKNKK